VRAGGDGGRRPSLRRAEGARAEGARAEGARAEGAPARLAREPTRPRADSPESRLTRDAFPGGGVRARCVVARKEPRETSCRRRRPE
jgi:hypothetical protein